MTDRRPRYLRQDDPPEVDPSAHDDHEDSPTSTRMTSTTTTSTRTTSTRMTSTTTATSSSTSTTTSSCARLVTGPALPHGRAWCCCSCSAILAAAAAFWVQRQIDPPGEPGEPQELVIPEGSTSDDIGKLLAAEGIISSDFVWEWYLRINGGGPFQAGTYQLAENSAIADVIDTLDAGPAPIEERSFTVPEALTAEGDPRSARRPRGGARLRSGQAPGADGQRPDPLVGPAGRPAVERGDPVPRDVPHRGRRRRGGRAPQARGAARIGDDRARTWPPPRSASTSRPTRC